MRKSIRFACSAGSCSARIILPRIIVAEHGAISLVGNKPDCGVRDFFELCVFSQQFFLLKVWPSPMIYFCQFWKRLAAGSRSPTPSVAYFFFVPLRHGRIKFHRNENCCSLLYSSGSRRL